MALTLFISILSIGSAVYTPPQEYYTWDGKSLVEITNPRNVSAKEWQIWCYQDINGRRARSGTIIGKSADDCLTKLDKAIKQNKLLASWNRDGDNTFLEEEYADTVGPIAILSDKAALTLESGEELLSSDIRAKANRMIDAYKSLLTKTSIRQYLGLPSELKPKGSALKEYATLLEDSFKNTRMLEASLNRLSSTSDLNAMASESERLLKAAENFEPQLASNWREEGWTAWRQVEPFADQRNAELVEASRSLEYSVLKSSDTDWYLAVRWRGNRSYSRLKLTIKYRWKSGTENYMQDKELTLQDVTKINPWEDVNRTTFVVHSSQVWRQDPIVLIGVDLRRY